MNNKFRDFKSKCIKGVKCNYKDKEYDVVALALKNIYAEMDTIQDYIDHYKRMQDIKMIKKYEALLRKSQLRYKSILNSIGIGIKL